MERGTGAISSLYALCTPLSLYLFHIVTLFYSEHFIHYGDRDRSRDRYSLSFFTKGEYTKKRTAKQINMFQKHCDLKTIIQNQSSELSRGGELRWEYGGFSQLSKQTDKIPRWIDHLRI